MNEERIYVEYSDELRRALAKLDVDMAQLVREELAKDNTQVKVTQAPDPIKAGNEERDLALLIIVSGVAVSLVAGAVARVIDAVTKRKATQGEVKNFEVALDGKGKAIRDSAGNPVYNVSAKPSLIPESRPEKTRVDLIKLLKFDFQR
jgi:hypothetical protein